MYHFPLSFPVHLLSKGKEVAWNPDCNAKLAHNSVRLQQLDSSRHNLLLQRLIPQTLNRNLINPTTARRIILNPKLNLPRLSTIQPESI
jgi:hypothetical protein